MTLRADPHLRHARIVAVAQPPAARIGGGAAGALRGSPWGRSDTNLGPFPDVADHVVKADSRWPGRLPTGEVRSQPSGIWLANGNSPCQ